MDSVSSGIPLRDERMRDDLFEVERFAEATIKAQIDLRPINDLANGAQIELRLPLTYHFEPGHARDGVTLRVPAPLLPQSSQPLPCKWRNKVKRLSRS